MRSDLYWLCSIIAEDCRKQLAADTVEQNINSSGCLMSHKTGHILFLPSVSFRLFTKLVLEAPVITESALEVIRRYCEDEVSVTMKTQLLLLSCNHPHNCWTYNNIIMINLSLFLIHKQLLKVLHSKKN